MHACRTTVSAQAPESIVNSESENYVPYSHTITCLAPPPHALKHNAQSTCPLFFPAVVPLRMSSMET